MKKIIFISLICLLQITFVNGQANDPEKKLNAAIYEEEINGDLQEAITLYQEIVKKFPNERPVVAEALYRNGLANEKLGNLKAMQYYEKVINNYADQPELVKLAQTRLDRMLKTKKPTVAQLTSLRLSELNKEDDKSLSVINLYKEGSWLESSSLSPDGTKLAGIEYSIGQNVNIYDRLTGVTQMITNYGWVNKNDGYTYYPIWSPDSQNIAYWFYNISTKTDEIQVSTLKGKKRTIVKNEFGDFKIIPKQWSQDGNNILTFKQDSTGFYTIGLVSVKEGSFKALHKTKWKERFIDGYASLSPDGKYVVFADESKGNLGLFIMDTKGNAAPILLNDHPANEYNPLWSPDGKHIAFIRETKGESILYAMEMEKGKSIGRPFLIKQGMKNVDLINWTKFGISYDFSLDLNEIYTFPLDKTGTPKGAPKIIDYTTGSNICPVWSHDGKHLAFITFDGKPKVVVKTDGGQTKHYIIPIDDFWHYAVNDLRWLPDNSGVGFNHINKSIISSVYRLNLATGEWNKWFLPLDGGWTRIDWGPDKNSFVYNKPNKGFYQFDINTGESKKIFHPDNNETWYVSRGLKFSRDHKKLTFMLQNYNKTKNLMVYDLELGKSKTLSQDYWKPTFSPDGNKILAFGKKQSVAIISLEGEVLQEYDLSKHFESGTGISSPDWSPDGKQLVFKTRYIKYDTYLLKNVLK